jgi:hypothetical protein
MTMATILPFPDERANGRKRKRDSINSMGIWALNNVDERPANVVRFSSLRADAAKHDHGHLGLMLAATILKMLPEEQQSMILATLRSIEDYSRGDTRATALLDYLDAGRR